MDELLRLLDTYGVALLFIVILLKEIGVPVPIPGDVLMLVAGARAATGTLSLVEVLLAATLAGVMGASVQYVAARGPGRGVIYRFGKYIGLTPARLGKAADFIKGRGWVGVAIGRALPGLRIGAVAAAGLAEVPPRTFLLGLTAGTALFVGFHTLLGFVAGPGVGQVLSGVNIPVVAFLVLVALLGLAGWLLIRSRRARARQEGAVIFDWADACCPVCLAAARLAEATNKQVVASAS